jgi:hypothetical protein
MAWRHRHHGVWFVEKNASPEQKIRIIDVYVLGVGLSQRWPLMLESLAFGLVLLAQRAIYRHRLYTKQLELDRAAKWKTDHQRDRTGAPLHSSDPPELGK